MKYELRSPCDNCPFRKDGGIRLRAGRVRELIAATGNPGGEFACHKTTRDKDDRRIATAESQHCAGALIFADKRGTSTQMTRIMERLGGFDVTRLKGHDLVFDGPREMLASAIDAQPGARIRDACNVSDVGCDAPASAEDPARFECWPCGLDVCNACSTMLYSRRRGRRVRVCNNCRDERGDEFSVEPPRSAAPTRKVRRTR